MDSRAPRSHSSVSSTRLQAQAAAAATDTTRTPEPLTGLDRSPLIAAQRQQLMQLFGSHAHAGQPTPTGSVLSRFSVRGGPKQLPQGAPSWPREVKNADDLKAWLEAIRAGLFSEKDMSLTLGLALLENEQSSDEELRDFNIDAIKQATEAWEARHNSKLPAPKPIKGVKADELRGKKKVGPVDADEPQPTEELVADMIKLHGRS